MANKKLSLSKEGKDYLEEIIDILEIERVHILKIALAKGIATEKEMVIDMSSTPKWTIPDSIIKDEEYVMFKHLIINKHGLYLNDEEIQVKILHFIESGMRILKNELDGKTSLEDARFVLF